MKIVRVTYTTTAAYAAKNRENIQQVIADLRAGGHAGINYTACVAADEKTFTHTAFFRSEDDQQLLNQLPAFMKFQQELKANGFETPPKQELLILVGASQELFAG